MTNQNRSKLPFGCVIAAGIVSILCGGTFLLFMVRGLFATTPAPTLDTNTIATYVFETALAINLQTISAASPTVEFTPTSLPPATDTQTPISIPVTGASCIPNNPPQTGKVVQVVDGDTIKVILDQDGLTYTVRYIGMDTPENTSQIEYFGAEATTKNTELVGDKTVTLIKDISETDRYGRLLRYVLVGNIFVNFELVAQGYANTASYPPDISCIPTFQAAEQQASVSKVGFWAAPPTLVPLPTAVSSGGSSDGNAPCNCSGPDLDCKDFNSHASAQACYNYCVSHGFGDVFRLDGNDNDGRACESLP